MKQTRMKRRRRRKTVVVVVLTRRNRGGSAQHVDKEHREEAVFTHESITKEDPPNAHQAQHRPKPRFGECVASVHS